jgi:hypothetical protein
MSPLFTKIWKSCCNEGMSQVTFGIAMSLAHKQGGMEGASPGQEGGVECVFHHSEGVGMVFSTRVHQCRRLPCSKLLHFL